MTMNPKYSDKMYTSQLTTGAAHAEVCAMPVHRRSTCRWRARRAQTARLRSRSGQRATAASALSESRQHGWQRGAAQPPTKGQGVPSAGGKLCLVSGAAGWQHCSGLYSCAAIVPSRALPELHGTGRCVAGMPAVAGTSARWTVRARGTAGCGGHQPAGLAQQGWPQKQRGGGGPEWPQLARPAGRELGRAFQLESARGCWGREALGSGGGSAAGCIVSQTVRCALLGMQQSGAPGMAGQVYSWRGCGWGRLCLSGGGAAQGVLQGWAAL